MPEPICAFYNPLDLKSHNNYNNMIVTSMKPTHVSLFTENLINQQKQVFSGSLSRSHWTVCRNSAKISDQNKQRSQQEEWKECEFTGLMYGLHWQRYSSCCWWQALSQNPGPTFPTCKEYYRISNDDDGGNGIGTTNGTANKNSQQQLDRLFAAIKQLTPTVSELGDKVGRLEHSQNEQASRIDQRLGIMEKAINRRLIDV